MASYFENVVWEPTSQSLSVRQPVRTPSELAGTAGASRRFASWSFWYSSTSTRRILRWEPTLRYGIWLASNSLIK